MAGKILVIGAGGRHGDAVVAALGEEHCIRASPSSAETVDIMDPRSIAALFDRVGGVDGVICTGGVTRFKPWSEMADEDWIFSLANKLLGQVNVIRIGARHVAAGGAISGARQLDYHHCQRRDRSFARAAVAEPSIAIRVNVVSPGWVSETLKAMGRDPVVSIPPAEVAKAFVRQLREGASGSTLPSAKS